MAIWTHTPFVGQWLWRLACKLYRRPRFPKILLQCSQPESHGGTCPRVNMTHRGETVLTSSLKTLQQLHDEHISILQGPIPKRFKLHCQEIIKNRSPRDGWTPRGNTSKEHKHTHQVPLRFFLTHINLTLHILLITDESVPEHVNVMEISRHDEGKEEQH